MWPRYFFLLSLVEFRVNGKILMFKAMIVLVCSFMSAANFNVV